MSVIANVKGLQILDSRGNLMAEEE